MLPRLKEKGKPLRKKVVVAEKYSTFFQTWQIIRRATLTGPVACRCVIIPSRLPTLRTREWYAAEEPESIDCDEEKEKKTFPFFFVSRRCCPRTWKGSYTGRIWSTSTDCVIQLKLHGLCPCLTFRIRSASSGAFLHMWVHLYRKRSIPLLPQTTDVKMVIFRCPQVTWQFQTPVRFREVERGLNME
jgi:hypothetical protein